MNFLAFSSLNNLFVSFLASFLIWFMFFALFFFWKAGGKKNKEIFFHAFLACLFAWSFAHMIKDFFPTLRPFVINGYPPLTITNPLGGSFPSAHAAGAFALAVSVWLHRKKVGFLFLIGAMLVCLGRIISNVHYPIDILGGIVIGAFVALAFGELHLGRFLKGK